MQTRRLCSIVEYFLSNQVADPTTTRVRYHTYSEPKAGSWPSSSKFEVGMF